MRAKKKVQRNLARDFRRYKDRIAGILGDYSGTVEVPNRSGYVFVRLANQEVKEAFNKKVPNIVDLPVWVGYADDPQEKHILQVLDTRTGVERQKGENPISQFLPLHHQTHEWFNLNGGQDVVFSDKRQFMPFRPTPAGGMLLHVYRNVGWLNGQYTYFSGSSIDLSPYVPATGAYFGLIYEDINATLAFSSGTGDFLKDGFSLTLADIPNPVPGTYPIAAVRMWGGQTGIVEAAERTDLVDLRFPFTYGFLLNYDTPSSYTGSANQVVSVKSDETGLEFVNNTGTFSGSSAGGDLDGIYPNPTVDAIQGNSVQSGIPSNNQILIYNSSTNQWEFVDQSGGGGSGALSIYDDSVFKVTGTAISFDENLNVSITGSIAYISAAGIGGDSTYKATYASRPAASNDGDLFLPTDGFQIERDTGAAWEPWGPLFPFTAPVDGDFAWVNQGGASVVTAQGGIVLQDVATSAFSARVRKKSAPAAPYTLTTAFVVPPYMSNFNQCGVGWRQSSDGKLVLVRYSINSSFGPFKALYISNCDSETSIASNPVGPLLWHGPLVFVKLEDDNTDRVIYISNDGQTWLEINRVGRTSYLTADEILFYCASQNSTYVSAITLLHWKEA